MLAVLVPALVPAQLKDPHLVLSPSISTAMQKMGKSAPDMKGISGHHRKK